VRKWIGCLGIFCCGLLAVQADRLIRIPTGSLISPARAKAELGIENGSSSVTRYEIGLRVNDFFEVDGSRYESTTGRTIDAFHMQFNVYPEILSYAPGISVGVRDLFHKTPEGTGYYLALSYRVPLLGEHPLDRDLILHLGYGWRGVNGFFMGVEAPLTNQFLILAEHDSHSLNAAFVWQPMNAVQVRWNVVNERTFASVMIQFGM
jgi:hypothetical protein